MRRASFTETEFRAAVEAADTVSAALRALGLRAAGGNYGTFRRYAALWNVSTEHMRLAAERRRPPLRDAIPLEQVLVQGSTYNRVRLKERLYRSGLKQRTCERCGQGRRGRGVACR